MSGFTKLVPEIVLSSIWNQPPEVRCVWIAMLATKDENGYVRGNPASLARTANVSIESARIALDVFQSPDTESNTQDNDGRRIQPVPGGWFVLNHALYRGKDYREYEAERKKEYRKNHPLSGTRPGQVPDASASSSESASLVEGECKGGEKAGTSNMPEKKPRKNSRGELVGYGEFKRVLMTVEEFEKIKNSYGDKTAQAINKLDAYMEAKNKKYDNCYAVLKRDGWVWNEVNKPTAQQKNQGGQFI